MRAIHPDTAAVIATGEYQIASLIKIELSTPIFITDYGYPIDWDGGTYTNSGHIITTPRTTETTELQVNDADFVLSGVDQSYYSLMIAGDPINKIFSLRKAVMVNGAIIGDPIESFVNGRITGYEIEEDDDGTAELTITVANHWRDFEKKNGRRTTTNSQRRFFLDDKGLEFAAAQDTDVLWGRN